MKKRGDAPAIHPGSRFDGYEVERLLGRPPVGVAYHGIEKSTGRDVSILMLDRVASPAGRKNFESEARRLVALHHPHLLEVIAFGDYGGAPYLVTDYREGGTIADLTGGRRVSAAHALEILRTVATAMDEAHRAGEVHGNLTPASILVGRDGGLVVAGIGLLTLPNDGPNLARSAAGAYTAPEQGRGAGLSPEADRYSVTAVAHFLWTGEAPSFEATTLRRSAAIGPASHQVLRRGLAYRPEDRWPSCVAMVDALTEAVSTDIAATAPASSGGGWRSIVIAAACVVFLVAVAALIFWESSPQPPSLGIALSDTSIPQGGSLIVNGSGLPSNQVGTVELESAPQQVGAFQADANGNMTTRVTIPSNATPGGHVISLCWNGTCQASAKVTVTEVAASPTPTPSPMPTPSPSPSPSPTPSPVGEGEASPSSSP